MPTADYVLLFCWFTFALALILIWESANEPD